MTSPFVKLLFATLNKAYCNMLCHLASLTSKFLKTHLEPF
ncbi:hypothetical protein HMPREF1139_1471 [Campylobacter sp. FOBRC14]|nr:hypothetical protein HMPREF1139_1471 [Campylobacter sp. FOBRC14]